MWSPTRAVLPSVSTPPNARTGHRPLGRCPGSATLLGPGRAGPGEDERRGRGRVPSSGPMRAVVPFAVQGHRLADSVGAGRRELLWRLHVAPLRTNTSRPPPAQRRRGAHAGWWAALIRAMLPSPLSAASLKLSPGSRRRGAVNSICCDQSVPPLLVKTYAAPVAVTSLTLRSFDQRGVAIRAQRRDAELVTARAGSLGVSLLLTPRRGNGPTGAQPRPEWQAHHCANDPDAASVRPFDRPAFPSATRLHGIVEPGAGLP